MGLGLVLVWGEREREVVVGRRWEWVQGLRVSVVVVSFPADRRHDNPGFGMKLSKSISSPSF
jgi:hypothetical protein